MEAVKYVLADEWTILDGGAIHVTGLVLLIERDGGGKLHAFPVNAQHWLKGSGNTPQRLEALISQAVDAYATPASRTSF